MTYHNRFEHLELLGLRHENAELREQVAALEAQVEWLERHIALAQLVSGTHGVLH